MKEFEVVKWIYLYHVVRCSVAWLSLAAGKMSSWLKRSDVSFSDEKEKGGSMVELIKERDNHGKEEVKVLVEIRLWIKM